MTRRLLDSTTSPHATIPSHIYIPAMPTTTTSTLSLHDALPISSWPGWWRAASTAAWAAAASSEAAAAPPSDGARRRAWPPGWDRSEEHTSELQSRGHLVCRLLLEKKNG